MIQGYPLRYPGIPASYFRTTTSDPHIQLSFRSHPLHFGRKKKGFRIFIFPNKIFPAKRCLDFGVFPSSTCCFFCGLRGREEAAKMIQPSWPPSYCLMKTSNSSGCTDSSRALSPKGTSSRHFQRCGGRKWNNSLHIWENDCIITSPKHIQAIVGFFNLIKPII